MWLTNGSFASSKKRRNSASRGAGTSAAVTGYGLRYQLLRLRHVSRDSYIEVGGNRYSVPKRCVISRYRYEYRWMASCGSQ